MKNIKLLATLLVASIMVNAQIKLDEGWDDVNNLTDYKALNVSDVPSEIDAGWFQGNAEAFTAFDGASNSYLGANFEATAGSTIDLWVLTPRLGYKNGDIVSFYTRTTVGRKFRDRLELRIDPSGTADLPNSEDLGSYTKLLLSINPNLLKAGYPEFWTLQTFTISGLPANTTTTTRIAFRYWVTGGSPNGTNSSYIGIDRFVIKSVALSVEEFDIEGLIVYPNPSNGIFTLQNTNNIDLTSATIHDINGRQIKSVNLQNTENSERIDLSNVASGMYLMTINSNSAKHTIKLFKK